MLLLFQLLYEMDGLGEDIDVAFILTTNRADLLEPGLGGPGPTGSTRRWRFPCPTEPRDGVC